MHHFFRSTFFNFEALRIIGTAGTSGADIAESLTAIYHIKDNDAQSWHKAWLAAAETAVSIAEDARRAGNRVAARNALLRAANYLRASEFMIQSPETLSQSQRARATFRKALDFFDHPVVTFDVPYTHTDGSVCKLPATLYLPAEIQRLPGRKTPIVLIVNGADSTQEELYHLYAAYGPPQGYATLTFDGPGQGIVLRRDKVLMRPDWEAVVGAVLDAVQSLATERDSLSLDTDRIAIVGASMGGYFALRGAVDPRIAACVSIDPFLDLFDFATTHVSPLFLRAWEAGWISDGVVDAMFGMLTRLNFQMRWEVSLTAWFFGTASASATLKEMKRYSVKHDGFLARIKVPTLVSGAPLSLYFDPDRHTFPILAGLTALKPEDKKSWMPGKEVAEGAMQGKVGAFALSAQRTFAFLNEAFEIKRQALCKSETLVDVAE